jgi:hypothetical protein
MYTGGTIYVDNATSFMWVVNQVSLNAAETIKGKEEFEREARASGVQVKKFRGDNGVFQSKEFKDDLSEKKSGD